MIVAAQNGTLRVITQNDHAHLAAELLSLWRSEGLPENPRREALLFAAREHDNGWREIDAAPRIDSATGRPHDFVSLPHSDRRELWQRGTLRYLDRQPYAALLVLQHARNLHRHLAEDADWRPILERWTELTEELLANLGASRQQMHEDYRWIDLADLFSLALCHRIDQLPERSGYRGRLAKEPPGQSQKVQGTLQLDPFPLAGSTTFSVPSRQIPDRSYRSDLDLAMELAMARWGQTTFRIVPWEDRA